MTLRISSSATRIDLDSKQSLKSSFGNSTAAVAGVSLEMARKREVENPRSIDPLRYELTSLNEQSVAIQREISSRQSTLSRLDQLKQEISNLSNAPSSESLSASVNNLRDLLGDSSSIGSLGLTKTAQTSSDNPAVDPVVVQEPPQVGSYKVSILGKVSADALQFEIEVADGPEFKKSLVTALSPATGIIEGVEIYFEEKEGQQEAEITVQSVANGEFPVPDFRGDIEQLSNSSEQPETFERRALALTRKVDTTIDGLQRSLDRELSNFQNIANAQENIRAAVSEPRSVTNAFSALQSLNTEISKQSSGLTNLFNSSDSVKNLLD